MTGGTLTRPCSSCGDIEILYRTCSFTKEACGGHARPQCKTCHLESVHGIIGPCLSVKFVNSRPGIYKDDEDFGGYGANARRELEDCRDW